MQPLDSTIVILNNEQASLQFAKQLATCLSVPCVFGFQGSVGAGKTTLIRAMLESMGVQGRIQSPTYSIMSRYETSLGDVFHFDLYRIVDEAELEDIGFRDSFNQNALSFIEWPENAPYFCSSMDVMCHLSFMNEGRQLCMSALTEQGRRLLACLTKIR